MEVDVWINSERIILIEIPERKIWYETALINLNLYWFYKNRKQKRLSLRSFIRLNYNNSRIKIYGYFPLKFSLIKKRTVTYLHELL